jgi:hypothetical protein
VWSWRPWAGVKLRKMRRGDGDNNAWSPGRARISRKPIAQGRPVDRLVPVVPAPCIFSHGGHGCGSHPVFPAPSVSEEGGLVGKARTPRAARMRTNILLVVMPAKAGIQYAAASRLKHRGLWNTGSPGQAGRRRRRGQGAAPNPHGEERGDAARLEPCGPYALRSHTISPRGIFRRLPRPRQQVRKIRDKI